MKKRVIKIILVLVIGCALAYAIMYALFQISKSRSFQFFGGLTHRVETTQKVVALTFDDAPTPHTPEVLDILAQKQAKATFYVIGENMEKYPAIASQIVESGMEVGNHSYSHPRFLLKPQAFIEQEIEKTNKLIRQTGYKGEITFRPPHGKKLFGLPWHLHKHGIQTITWDVEPDTYYSTKDEIVTYTLEHTKPGSIILMHPFCDSCGADREALLDIIDRLKTQGYTFVTVGELLSHKK